MSQKIIIIGATSGIGREMAIEYLHKGFKVGVTGRRASLLQALQTAYPQQVYTSCFDVQDEKCLQSLLKLLDEMQGMDLFIYNAGFGHPSDNLDPDMELKTVKTNVTGFVRLVSFAFNYFAVKGKGQIAVISSMAALRGNSLAPAYSASKAFISTYAEGLNLKAQKMQKQIVITDIKPGFMATKKAKGFKPFWAAPPQKAARQILHAIAQKKKSAYITRRWWLVAQLMKVIPYGLYKRLG